MVKNYELEDVVMRTPTEQYGYFECKVKGISNMIDLYELRAQIRKRELEDKYNCPHLFSQDLTSKKGEIYKQCPECGAMQFKRGSGWSPWIFPVKNKEEKK